MSVDQQQTLKEYYENKGYKPQDVALRPRQESLDCGVQQCL